MKSELLAVFERDGIIERQHFGFTVLINKKGKIIERKGDYNDCYFILRSCQKPLQALSFLKSGAFGSFGFSLKELAIGCSSHTGTKIHTDIAKGILAKIGLSENDLLCPQKDPLDIETKDNLIRNNLEPSKIHNNCSGKHSCMLAVCVHKGWDITNYTNPDHPLQKMIFEITEDYCGIKNPPLSFDGCGTPVYAMPLHKMCEGYLNVFLSSEGSLIKQAFLEYPFIIGGSCRLESKVMNASNQTLIAKNGAEGLFITVNVHEQTALGIKVLDGNFDAREKVLREYLQKLNWLQELS